MNWKKVIGVMGKEMVNGFVSGDLSYNKFYSHAVARGVGPEVRTLKNVGVARARKSAREALRRRELLTV